MGYGTSLGTAHEDEMSYVLERGMTDNSEKQRNDTIEINQNSRSGDFQSRFYATDASTMPLEASRKLTDALKSYGGSQTPGKPFETNLTPFEERSFQDWKAVNALKDSGEDYDLRGAFKAGITPDAETGHWPDTFKKPNHPTFSDQSQYYKDAPDKAGSWDGERFIPPAVRSTLAEDFFGKGENDIRPTLNHFYDTVKNAFKLPGDVYSGKVPAGSVQEIERAADLAGFMIGGPAPVAAKLADGSLGSFAGVRSLSKPDPATAVLKEKLYQAQNMELDMVHPDDIWSKTGFFRGADRRWRYEISDKDAKLKPEAFDTIITQSNPKAGGEMTETIIPKTSPVRPKEFTSHEQFIQYITGKKKEPLTLDKVIDHPELFKAYPELGTMKVEPLPEHLRASGVKGQVTGDTIYLAEGHPEYIKSVLLHEIQHGIQSHEGFAFGGMLEQFLPKELPQAEKEFLAMQSKEEPKIAKVLEQTGFSIKQFKLAVEAEQVGITIGEMPGAYADRIKFLKEQHPIEYRKLTNIVKSERLLAEAKVEAFTKYRNLMGEVEARNVQARADLSDFMRKHSPPDITEDTFRSLQHNPK